jgi:DNA repair protein RecO (recombination protein O)
MPNNNFNTKAVILKRYKISDDDYSFIMLTDNFGKINVWLKNAKNSLKKFGVNLDIFSIIDIVFFKYKKKDNDTNILRSARILDYNYNLRLNLKKFETANFALDIINRITPLADGKESFLLIEKFLSIIDNLEINDKYLEFLKVSFVFILLADTGYKFEISQCIDCGITVPNNIKNIFFSLNSGGVICNNCVKNSINYDNHLKLDKNLLFFLNKCYNLKIYNFNIEDLKNIDKKYFDVIETEDFNNFFYKILEIYTHTKY